MKTGRAYIFKLMLLGMFLLLYASKISAQTLDNLRLELQKSKPDTNRVHIMLYLGYEYFHVHVPHKNYMDSALNLFNQAAKLSNQLHAVYWQYRTLEYFGYYYAAKGNFDRCRQYFMHIVAHYKQTGEISRQATIWKDLGNVDGIDYKERLSCYQHARLLYLQNHQPIKVADMLRSTADVRRMYKQFDMAEIDLQEALRLYKTAGYKSLQNTYRTLADLEQDKGNYYREADYCLQGVKSITSPKDTADISDFYSTIAYCNYAVKKYMEALLWINKAIAIRKYSGDFEYIQIQSLIALNRTTEARIALNDILSKKTGPLDTTEIYHTLALYYDKINKNEPAIKYYLKTLENIKGFRYKEDQYNAWGIMCDNAIAGIYLKMHQAEKAKKYIDTAATIIENAKTEIDPDLRVDFYDNSYKYNTAIGAYHTAILNLQRRVNLQDSLFTVDKDRQLAELNIKYQTTQQEQDIKTLHSQSVAQHATLEKANLQRNITIGGIVVMILLSALFYRNYKQKKLANNIITHKNELLQHLLTEKEWLLKEVHHRVKNNLHTVICLLESQARYLENDALQAIENSQHRIYAMSLIHQKLYQSDDIKTIDMAVYLSELVQSLEDGFDSAGQIQFKLHIEQINLALSHAIPIGLIVNEAVTNSIKYAFPGKRKGEIFISMIEDRGIINLELADNGIGMPKIDSENEPGSLGLRLMKGLSEDIEAIISFEVDNGTRISIIFKPESLNTTENIFISSEIKEGYL